LELPTSSLIHELYEDARCSADGSAIRPCAGSGRMTPSSTPQLTVWYRRAPVELLLMEEDNNRSSLIYVQPSSLMVVETNPLLLAAARELDAKLAALASAIA